MMRMSLMLLALSLLGSGCGLEENAKNTSTNGATAEFSAVSPIISKSCGTADCHGSASNNNVYVDKESAVQSSAAAIKARLESTSDSLVMPQAGSAQAAGFSAADRASLLGYLNSYL